MPKFQYTIKPNNITITHPELVKQWDYEKNGDMRPEYFTYGSRYKAHWVDEFKHEWTAPIAKRAIRGHGCPYCSSKGTSRPEVTVYYYLKKYINTKVYHRYRNFGFELDVYMEYNGKKIAIEYDGFYSHKDKEKKDLLKNQKCAELNIILYRIRELPLKTLNSTSIDILYQYPKNEELSSVIENIIFYITNEKVHINIEEDNTDINLLTNTITKEKSIEALRPDLAEEWHPTANGLLLPSQVSAGSNIKVEWLGKECKHQYTMSPSSRNKGRGCPYCSGQRILVGFNDLKTLYPDIANQWCAELNGDNKPENYTAKSNKVFSWECDEGHIWEAPIFSRTRGKGCPYCANKIVDVSKSLKATHPYLAAEWHPTKNGDLTPEKVTAGSGKKVWWKNDKRGEFQATICNRIRKYRNSIR